MKLVQRIIIFIGLLSIITACGSSSSEKDTTSIEPNAFLLSDIITIPGMNQRFIEPLHELNLNAESAFLIHVDTNDVLYENHSDEALPIASMSKIMTELLVLEAIEAGELDWSDKVEVSDYAYTISNTPGYASVLLKKDKKYTVQELFAAMAIRSANGATIALAEAVSGTEIEFVHLMNDRAEKLDLTSAEFVNSTGLTNKHLKGFDTIGKLEDTNVMSASDLSRLALYVMNNYPILLDITNQKELDFHGETFKNSNWMLPGAEVDLIEEDVTFDGVNGLKTGHTEEAGYCFTGSVEIDGEQFISVVIGTPEIGDHFIETKKLYEGLEKQMEMK